MERVASGIPASLRPPAKWRAVDVRRPGFRHDRPCRGVSRGAGIGDPSLSHLLRPGTGRSHPSLWSATINRTPIQLQGSDVRKGEQTRQEIIRKAAPIFNQKGYDGAALSDLMRATG